MKSCHRISLLGCVAAVLLAGGCVTGPKKLEPVTTPPPQSQLLKGLDVVQQPELEPDWADFLIAKYPLWRQNYWVDRGQWGNRGYLIGKAPAATEPVVEQMQPQPLAPTEPTTTAVVTPPPAAPPAITIVESEPPKLAKPARPTTYVVKKNDSLWKIAGKIYRNPLKWVKIYRANKDKIKHPNRIYTGQVLKIPPN
jgi:hypothetical protein